MNTVSIGYGDKHHVAAVVCQHDDGEPTIILPFGGERINSVAAIDADRIAVLGAEGNLAIHHQRSGALLASGKGALKSGTLLACGKHLLVHGHSRISNWSVDPLQELWWADCIADHDGRPRLASLATLREKYGNDAVDKMKTKGTALPLAMGSNATVLADGRVFFPMHNLYWGDDPATGKSRPTVYGYVIVDAESAAIEAATVQRAADDSMANKFLSVSPSGRYAIRCDCGEIPYSSGGTSLLKAFTRGWGDLTEGHRDARKDRRERFGIILEIWRLGDVPSIESRLTVRMIEPQHVSKGTSKRGRLESYADTLHSVGRHLKSVAARQPANGSRTHFLDSDSQFKFRRLYEVIAGIAWQPDESAFWIEFKNSILRRVSRDGSLSPLLVFRRWQVATDPLDSAVDRFVLRRSFEFLPDGRIRFGSDISAPSGGHVTWDPTLIESPGDLIIVGPEEDSFHQLPSHGKAIDKAVRQRSFVQQKIASMDEAGVNAALLELAAKLDGNVASLCWGNLLRFRFVSAGKALKEKDLFALMVANGWRGAVPGLKALLTGYLNSIEGGEGHQPWYDGENGIAALAYALRAQLFLDPDDFTLWWKYLAKRDDEHEGYLFDRLLPEYVERFGWRGEPGLRFGINVAIFEHFKGETQPWSNHDLIDAAERLVGPDRFADMLFEAAQGFGFTSPVSQYLRRLTSLLDQSQPYQAAVTVAVSRRIASELPPGS